MLAGCCLHIQPCMHAGLRCNVYLIAVRTYISDIYCLKHCVTSVPQNAARPTHPPPTRAHACTHAHTHTRACTYTYAHGTMQLDLPSLTDLDEHISCPFGSAAAVCYTSMHICNCTYTNCTSPPLYSQCNKHTLAPFTLRTSTNLQLHQYMQGRAAK